MMAVYPSGLSATICSNGIINFKYSAPSTSTSTPSTTSFPFPMNGKMPLTVIGGAPTGSTPTGSPTNKKISTVRCTDPSMHFGESGRYICSGASVVRHIPKGPYARDILTPKGERILLRRMENPSVIPEIRVRVTDRSFHGKLLNKAPEGNTISLPPSSPPTHLPLFSHTFILYHLTPRFPRPLSITQTGPIYACTLTVGYVISPMTSTPIQSLWEHHSRNLVYPYQHLREGQ